MSSCGNPEAESAALMPHRLKFDKSRTCVKCKSSPGNLVVRHAVYCKDCFSPLITTKFKRILEPAVNPATHRARRKALKAEGNLFLAFSGGLGSTVLLDLVSKCYFTPSDEDDENPRGGKNHPRNGNVWERVFVCYIETCASFPEITDRTDDIRAVVERYEGFELMALRLENAFDKSWWGRVGQPPSDLQLNVDVADQDLLLSILRAPDDSDPVALLRSYISSLPTQTAISSTIRTLVRMLLLYTARSLGCSHVLLGTSLTSLSVALISSIAQGGGFAVREEIEEQWTPTGTDVKEQPESSESHRYIRIIRPLREIGMKECAIWAWWNGLRIVGRAPLLGVNEGIGGLTKNFIVGLEQDYPSTVSAIARTCGKLTPKEKSASTCAICQRPVPFGVQEWKARISIRTLDPMGETQVVQDAEESAALRRYLCYACHTTLTSRSSRGTPKQMSGIPGTVALPVWVHDRFRDSNLGGDKNELETKQRNSDAMRTAISEYLLD